MSKCNIPSCKNEATERCSDCGDDFCLDHIGFEPEYDEWGEGVYGGWGCLHHWQIKDELNKESNPSGTVRSAVSVRSADVCSTGNDEE